MNTPNLIMLSQKIGRARPDAVDNQRDAILHRKADDRARRGISHLKNSRKSLLQIDRARLQPQYSEGGGKALGLERDALCFAEPYDAPEMIEVRRATDLHEIGFN